MASALPVVAFDDAAAHAAIVPGVNGVTVPTEDRAGFVAAAVRRTAEGMSWERVLGGVEDRLLADVRRRGVGGAHETLARTVE